MTFSQRNVLAGGSVRARWAGWPGGRVREAPGKTALATGSSAEPEVSRWLSNPATLDVPCPVAEFLARLLAAHRRHLGTPKGSRALGCFRQAVLVLRWFGEDGCVHCLAHDARVSQTTGYRYLQEGIDFLAEQTPDLHTVLERGHEQGLRSCS